MMSHVNPMLSVHERSRPDLIGDVHADGLSTPRSGHRWRTSGRTARPWKQASQHTPKNTEQNGYGNN